MIKNIELTSNRFSKLLMFLLFITVSQLSAQNKYIKWIEKKQYQRTSRTLPKVLEKKSDKPIDLMNAYYALAFLKNQREYKDFSTITAYQDILMAFNCYEDAKFMDPKKLAKDDLNLNILREYLEIICNNAFVDVSEKDTVDEYNYFLNNFSRMSYDLRIKTITQRNKKAFSNTKLTDTEAAYISYIETYPGTVFITEAVSLRNMRAYENSLTDDTIAAYENFLARYNNADQAPLAQSRIHELAFLKAQNQNTAAAYLKFYNKYIDSKQAERAFKRFEECQFLENTTIGNWSSYVNFRNTYSQSPWRNVANDSIYNIAVAKEIPRALEYTIQEDSSFHTLDNITTYYGWISKDGELSTLERFAEQFPYDYQKIEDYDTDLSLAKLAFDLYLTQSLQLTERKGAVASDEMGKRLQREGAKSGAIQISLSWDNFNDLDLHCIDPLGNEIYFSQKISPSGGELDIDMNARAQHSIEPVENINWSEGSVPEGEYIVYVKHYSNYNCGYNCKDPTDYHVRVKNGLYTNDYYGRISTNDDFIEVVKFNFKPTKFGDVEITRNNKFKYIEYIKKAAPKELAYVALQKVLANDIESKRWKSALKALKKLKPYFKGSKKVQNLETILSSEYDRSIRAVNLTAINTSGDEYQPVISANNQILFFCGNNRYDNIGMEDVFTSYAYDNSWSSASLQQTLSSSEKNDAFMAISSDGNTAISFQDGKLGTIQRTINGWSEIKDLPISINTGSWNADAMISSDNTTIIFTSTREIGYNHSNYKEYHATANKYASDLFAVQKNNSGEWGTPVNMGEVINTPYSERSPFLHPDMKTLYFSSDGHGGLGNYDVYKSTRQDEDCWDCWSKPVNMGKEINTIDDDWGYKISTDGNNAYFAKKVKGEDHFDLYTLNIPYYLRPDYVATISGKIEGLDNQIIPAEIVWEDLETQTQIGRSQTNPETGEYFIVLPMGKIYGYYIDKDDFFPFSSSLDLREETEAINLDKNIKIISFEEMIDNQIPVPISNLFFGTGSNRLQRLSFAELDRLARILNKTPLRVEITGHTDNVGSEEVNLNLSQERAARVKKYLVKKGCNPERIETVGKGASEPVSENETTEGRQKNRRVTIRFIEKIRN